MSFQSGAVSPLVYNEGAWSRLDKASRLNNPKNNDDTPQTTTQSTTNTPTESLDAVDIHRRVTETATLEEPTGLLTNRWVWLGAGGTGFMGLGGGTLVHRWMNAYQHGVEIGQGQRKAAPPTYDVPFAKELEQSLSALGNRPSQLMDNISEFQTLRQQRGWAKGELIYCLGNQSDAFLQHGGQLLKNVLTTPLRYCLPKQLKDNIEKTILPTNFTETFSPKLRQLEGFEGNKADVVKFFIKLEVVAPSVTAKLLQSIADNKELSEKAPALKEYAESARSSRDSSRSLKEAQQFANQLFGQQWQQEGVTLKQFKHLASGSIADSYKVVVADATGNTRTEVLKLLRADAQHIDLELEGTKKLLKQLIAEAKNQSGGDSQGLVRLLSFLQRNLESYGEGWKAETNMLNEVGNIEKAAKAAVRAGSHTPLFDVPKVYGTGLSEGFRLELAQGVPLERITKYLEVLHEFRQSTHPQHTAFQQLVATHPSPQAVVDFVTKHAPMVNQHQYSLANDIKAHPWMAELFHLGKQGEPSPLAQKVGLSYQNAMEQMMFHADWSHADPHGGNVFVNAVKNAKGDWETKLNYIDWGSILENKREELIGKVMFFVHFLTGNTDRVAKDFLSNFDVKETERASVTQQFKGLIDTTFYKKQSPQYKTPQHAWEMIEDKLKQLKTLPADEQEQVKKRLLLLLQEWYNTPENVGSKEGQAKLQTLLNDCLSTDCHKTKNVLEKTLTTIRDDLLRSHGFLNLTSMDANLNVIGAMSYNLGEGLSMTPRASLGVRGVQIAGAQYKKLATLTGLPSDAVQQSIQRVFQELASSTFTNWNLAKLFVGAAGQQVVGFFKQPEATLNRVGQLIGWAQRKSQSTDKLKEAAKDIKPWLNPKVWLLGLGLASAGTFAYAMGLPPPIQHTRVGTRKREV
ncbi:MAG: AarF/UbiB family protein [Vampirovibrionales bacterium]